MSFYEHAAANAKIGLQSFPYYPMDEAGNCLCPTSNCNAAGKHPRVRGFNDQATTGLQKLKIWDEQFPGCGIGIHPVGFFSIDIDGNEATAALEVIEKKFGKLPWTYRINSGNSKPNHYQLLFRLPDDLRVLSKPLRGHHSEFEEFQGIDIKGERSQIASVGNRHKTGGIYRWHDKTPRIVDDFTKAPSWLLERLETVNSTEDRFRREKAKKAKGKPRRNNSGDFSFDDESDAYYDFHLKNRFPILCPSMRRGIILEAVNWLLNTRGLSAVRTRSLLEEHLYQFQNNFDSELDAAIKDMSLSISSHRKAVATGSLKRSKTPKNHSEAAAAQKLIPVLDSFLEKVVYGTKYRMHTVFSRPRRISSKEELFLRILLMRYQYEVYYHQRNDHFQFTQGQIMEMYALLGEKAPTPVTFYKYKALYISGTNSKRHKTKYEVFRQTEKGYSGMPSTFEPVKAPVLDLKDLKLECDQDEYWSPR